MDVWQLCFHYNISFFRIRLHLLFKSSSKRIVYRLRKANGRASLFGICCPRTLQNIEDRHYSDFEIVEYLLAFVQESITYKAASYAIQTLITGYGDCTKASETGLSLYNRNGTIGIEDGRNYRLSTLGFWLEKLQELDEREMRMNNLESIRAEREIQVERENGKTETMQNSEKREFENLE